MIQPFVFQLYPPLKQHPGIKAVLPTQWSIPDYLFLSAPSPWESQPGSVRSRPRHLEPQDHRWRSRHSPPHTACESSSSWAIPPLVLAPKRSARTGEWLTMNVWSTSCQTGNMTFEPLPISRAARPASSRSGQALPKKAGLRITTPNLLLTKALSILPLRLSPTVSCNSSSHTVQPKSTSASASGRATACLSSLACETKKSNTCGLASMGLSMVDGDRLNRLHPSNQSRKRSGRAKGRTHADVETDRTAERRSFGAKGLGRSGGLTTSTT